MSFLGGRRRRAHRRSHRRRATRSRLGTAFGTIESGFGNVLGTVGLRKPANYVARTIRLSRGGSQCGSMRYGGTRRRRRSRRRH